MGQITSLLQADSPGRTAAPGAAPKGDAAAVSEPSNSSSEDKKQPQAKREGIHNFNEIVGWDQNITQDQACTDTGVFLGSPTKTKRFWVDKRKTNCFMLFPRGLSIIWGENSSYWTWPSLGDGSDGAGGGAGIEMAELKNVCWLEVRGELELSHLTPGVAYEVVFEVMVKARSYGWHVKVDLRLKFPDGRIQERKESLEEQPRDEWLRLKVGDVETHRGQNGVLVISLSEYGGGHWKKGLVVKGIRITPKE